MTLNETIMQLVLLNEHSMMPVIFRPTIQKVIETISELEAQPEQHWILVKERNPIEYDNPIEFMATLEDPSGERYVEFIEWDGYEWDDFYTDDNERGVWGQDKVIAWMKKPEPFKGDLNE